MLSTEDTIKNIELSIEEAKQSVDLKLALGRLIKNRDFKKVIEEGYLRNEAIRLVHAKASPSLQSAEHQARITRDIDAIGALDQYLTTIYQIGSQAEYAVADYEQELETVRNEALEG